jgi:hypothetical protein
MQIENTRWYQIWDVAGHGAVSVATIDRAIEAGQLTAVTFGRETGAFWVGGAAVPALSAGGVSVVGAHCRCCGGHGIGPPGGDGRFECQVDPEGVLSPEERAWRGTAAMRGVHGVGTAQFPGPRQGGRCQAGSERSVEHGTRPARQLAGGGEVR